MFSRVGLVAKALQQISANIQVQQTRNTFIVTRRFPMGLIKKGQKPRQLKQKQYVYDLVKNANLDRRPDMQVVLLSFVEGIGFKGDVVSVRPEFGRNKLLLPKLAVYASPENIAKYAVKKEPSEENKEKLSAAMAARYISSSIASVNMSMDIPWTIEKFHVRIAFRKAGICVADNAIELPAKPIKGPNPDIEGKMFMVKVTINGKETVIGRCRIHHWTSDITRVRALVMTSKWEPVFPEDEETMKSLSFPSHFRKRKSSELDTK